MTTKRNTDVIKFSTKPTRRPRRRLPGPMCAVVCGLLLSLVALGCDSDDPEPPELTAVTPAAARHGETITLDGVRFGEVNDASRVVLTALDDEATLDMSDAVATWSDTSVTFVVPTTVHEESYIVHVDADGLLSNCIELDIVLPPDPAISVISPPAAKAGEAITLTGSDFGDTEGRVLFFPDTVAQIISWSAAGVVVTVPEGIDSDEVRIETGLGLLSTWFPFVIQEEAAPTLSLIQSTILTPRCAFGSCHGVGGSAGLTLINGQSYANLVGVASSQMASILRVDPSSPATSLLYDKVLNSTPAVGSRMPLAGAALPAEQVELIRAWIAAGALDN